MESSNYPAGAKSEVTLWFRMNEKGVFDFNHLEDGHAKADKPAQKHSSQSGWSKGKWVREHAWLDDSMPPKVLHDPQAEIARNLATTSWPA